MARIVRKARFPRLRELRETELGWEVADLAAKLPAGQLSTATLYRLEQGKSIRVTSARKVFEVINGALGGKLDVKKELIIEK
jgi:hypothetical protein